jgi:hypothetical protein
MGLTNAYLISSAKVKDIFRAIQNAQAPKKFTTGFLESLGLKSTNDRLVISVLKGLGFLNANGEPTARYFAFLDEGQAPRVLAEGLRDAYGDLFQVNTKAYELSQTEVKNKLKTLTQGKPSDTVLDHMARTFKTLSQLADFTAAPEPVAAEPAREEPAERPAPKPELHRPRAVSLGGLVYNIQLVLPDSRDTAVYDALFKSLKDHLLS